MKWLVTGLVVVLLIAFLVFFIRSRGGEMVMLADLDKQIVQPYIAMVAADEYDRAYDLLSEDYRKEVPLETFSAGHEKRQQEKGVISANELIRDSVIYNLFSTKREVRLKYVLYYGDNRETGWIILQEEDTDQFAIDGTYYESVGDSLDFRLW
ncbi:hypothetical protein Thiowin_01354 [Thiorhodovibrio winogradskyi]|uniref:DUF4829 domain-containing protein n=1 Tax=Thiorhodovibrio winogradskyi TaxID=77007 RepID=A0ABZ0S5U6_9GAMM|nr:hypothetical protein [Thiorhodovibrio winogradskyi]